MGVFPDFKLIMVMISKGTKNLNMYYLCESIRI